MITLSDYQHALDLVKKGDLGMLGIDKEICQTLSKLITIYGKDRQYNKERRALLNFCKKYVALECHKAVRPLDSDYYTVKGIHASVIDCLSIATQPSHDLCCNLIMSINERTNLLKFILKNASRCCAIVDLALLHVAGTVIAATGATLLGVGLTQKADVEKSVKASEPYALYRESEDKRLENLYKNTVAVAEERYLNGEIYKSELDDVKAEYQEEVKDSNNVHNYLVSVNNTEVLDKYDSKIDMVIAGSIVLGTGGAVYAVKFFEWLFDHEFDETWGEKIRDKMGNLAGNFKSDTVAYLDERKRIKTPTR